VSLCLVDCLVSSPQQNFGHLIAIHC
jgi:hypothetical protein